MTPQGQKSEHTLCYEHPSMWLQLKSRVQPRYQHRIPNLARQLDLNTAITAALSELDMSSSKKGVKPSALKAPLHSQLALERDKSNTGVRPTDCIGSKETWLGCILSVYWLQNHFQVFCWLVLPFSISISNLLWDLFLIDMWNISHWSRKSNINLALLRR